MDNLRDGRLIYLFTAVSSVGRRDGGGGAPGPPAAPAKYSLPCQGLSKLQELVKYHIYSHGQVRGSARRGRSLHLRLGFWKVACRSCSPGAPSPLPSRLDSHGGDQGGSCEPPGQGRVGPYGVARARPEATPSSTQLTVEKLISKGRVLTMANQVLAVNISEEVSSTNHVWNKWTSGRASGVASLRWAFVPQAPWRAGPGEAVWEAGTDQIPLLGPSRAGGLQRQGG